MMQPTFRTTIQRTPAEELTTTRWAGGATTELAIFPPGATVNSRDFSARVSTATVESDTAFSNFQGYRRILALLSGEGVTLTIDGKSNPLTEPFQVLEFDGGASVSGALKSGVVRDFNVIFRPEVSVRVQHVALSDTFREISCPSAEQMGRRNVTRGDIVWSPSNSLEIELSRNRTLLNPRDVFYLEHDARPVKLLARTTAGKGDILLVSLAFPVPERG